LAARLGAGKKNEDNTFSGVLLGDWTNVEDGSVPVTGVYGFDHNEQAYGFRENGTAFIGKNGSGRINFNGNEGIIYSENFNGIVLSVDPIANIPEFNKQDFIKAVLIDDNEADSAQVSSIDVSGDKIVISNLYVDSDSIEKGYWWKITDEQFLKHIAK
jgi:hypothetical protein